jgi:7-cyano-7-deazaguanine tRNA-ribosyltransferase
MLVVAGLSLKNLHPHVWDPNSPYYLSNLEAVMVSYADLHQMPGRRRKAMEQGIHGLLGVTGGLKVYLDNGAFYFLNKAGETPRDEYEEFVSKAHPDWYPIPQDFIPTPRMPLEIQKDYFKRTMQINLAYGHDGYTPVIHIGTFLTDP